MGNGDTRTSRGGPSHRTPLATVAAAHAIAGSVVLVSTALFSATSTTSIPLWAVLATEGALAAVVGHRLGLASWWVPINLLAPPAVAAAMDLSWPPWVFLAAFLALGLVYWNSAGERVPLYLTNRATWTALDSLLPRAAGLRFIDLGSGFGATIVNLARRHPDAWFTGVDTAPVPFVFCWSRLRFARLRNARVVYRDMWAVDLSEYDVAYCFLSPAPMPKLVDKALREMRSGTLLVSNSFGVDGMPADEVVAVDDRRRTRLLVWRM